MQSTSTATLAALDRALAHDFRVLPVDDPESPVFLAIAWPTSGPVTGLKPRLPSGRGLTLQQACIAAGAEALELRASLAGRHLADLAALPRQHGHAMATAQDLMTGQSVPVAAQSIYLDAAAALSEPLLCDATSTGCAAGATRIGARTSGLWECIERDALALWWHGGLAASALPLDLIDGKAPRLVWWLERRTRTTRLLDLTTDIGLPVVAAVSSDPDGRRVALGTAARPDLAAAAVAAVTEMVQTEFGMAQARAAGDPDLAEWEAFASTALQPQFQPSPQPRPATPPPDLPSRLAELGHQALAIDLTLERDPMPTMRVLVPGLCAMGDTLVTPRFQRLCPNSPGLCLPEPF
jgi:ribosomal protein S12 methylthiotransferase accessory factor YcaO